MKISYEDYVRSSNQTLMLEQECIIQALEDMGFKAFQDSPGARAVKM
jgi:hypothetical protein